MTSDYGTLVSMEKGDGIARVTFNRQEKRNAINSAMMAEFRAALHACWDCTVVTISGGDGPGFCSGIDLSESRAAPAGWERTYEDFMGAWERTNYLIWEHPAVCIASVNGYALAGGLSLVCSCDLAVASERAQFGMTEMGFGAFPGLAAPLASKVVLKKHLAELVFTVERIDAPTALRMGLVNYVVPHEELPARTDELARRIAQLDPVRVEQAKRAVNFLPQLDWTAASRFGGTIGGAGRNVTDMRSNVDRFLAGQPGLGQGGQPR